MSDETKEKLERYAAESARMYAGFHAPFMYKGVEYWVDRTKVEEVSKLEGVKPMPIFL